MKNVAIWGQSKQGFLSFSTVLIIMHDWGVNTLRVLLPLAPLSSFPRADAEMLWSEQMKREVTSPGLFIPLPAAINTCTEPRKKSTFSKNAQKRAQQPLWLSLF